MSYLFVALGGGLGAMLRFFVNQLVPFPFGTMSVNVIGSFLMGIAFILIGTKVGSKEVMFLMTGLLGGFTTFSAFCKAFLYVLLSTRNKTRLICIL